MTDNKEDPFKIGFGVWLCLCLIVCFWFFSNFVRNRRQFQTNLHVIEDGLKRMQDEMELRQRQKSIGFVENMEDITACLNNLHESETDEQKQEDSSLVGSLDETKEGNKSAEEVVDKKNV